MKICCLPSHTFSSTRTWSNARSMRTEDIGGFIGMSGYFTYERGINMVLADDDLGDLDPFSSNGQRQTKRKSVEAQVFERELLCLDAENEPSAERTAYRTPVFLGYGDADEKVRVRLGETAAAVMRSAGYKVHWKSYQRQGHWYRIPDEIADEHLDMVKRKAKEATREGMRPKRQFPGIVSTTFNIEKRKLKAERRLLENKGKYLKRLI
ncbi:acyl-protein thioesterase 1,2, putative [Cordyceps militaris CM01]|uniref:Acyl-protein thioesterase 1,2, putative n=1 Tax=Cordyceps militaris (strain CM01) TaxID=983644 RepID=G3JUY7_CORMM|nr:acyl-protein thioesterase 1,2, putative [Cordyceps militaris CM01]EGX87663.1 acyl-protein thioesterase 1,2, putative [Cordyceps militaris CM01]